MNDKNFTDDNEFRELKKLLKEIPKITAPENFEFNLMNKIQNQNFQIKSEKKKSVFSWALTPAIAFATAVFAFVFIFNFDEDFGEDPWKIAPQLIEKTIADVSNTNSINDKSEISIKSNSETFTSEDDAVLLQNKGIKDYPLNKINSVNLDDALQKGSNKGFNGSAQLAGANNSPFTGFFLREVEKPLAKDTVGVVKDSVKTDKNSK